VAIGGPGLPEEAKLRQDLPDAGLTNVTGAIMNLLGFQARILPTAVHVAKVAVT
jgi:hypothetical protein